MKKEREKLELERLGYTLTRISAKDKQIDPLLQTFQHKTFPNSAGTHGYFRSLMEVRKYIDEIKFIKSI